MVEETVCIHLLFQGKKNSDKNAAAGGIQQALLAHDPQHPARAGSDPGVTQAGPDLAGNRYRQAYEGWLYQGGIP